MTNRFDSTKLPSGESNPWLTDEAINAEVRKPENMLDTPEAASGYRQGAKDARDFYERRLITSQSFERICDPKLGGCGLSAEAHPCCEPCINADAVITAACLAWFGYEPQPWIMEHAIPKMRAALEAYEAAKR